MYAGDLINKDSKSAKYYFAKGGRQISLSVYKTNFIICQLFGEYKAISYNIDGLDRALAHMKSKFRLLDTIKYK